MNEERPALPGDGTGSRPGAVTLRVRDLAASLAFYRDFLGLEDRAGGDGGHILGAPGGDEALLVLRHAPDASARPARSAGLFHLALRVPSRRDLGAFVLTLRSAGSIPGGGSLEGASDHGVSRALYLADPEGNGVEVYHDRPREAWPRDGGRLRMWTRPLDVGPLVEGVEGPVPLPAGTTMGHVHLRTADLAAAEAFWTRETGMEVTTRDYPGALFLAHGGYHHHLGLNVWGGPLEAAVSGTAGLAELEWLLAADGTGRRGDRELRTPDGIRVRIRTGGG